MNVNITIITSYFGEFNTYFPLWMKSVSLNSSISFKLITDNNPKELPCNVELVKMPFSEMQSRIKNFFDFPIVVDTGYKMSEYQPLFALIFPELVEGATFWGYCEMDLILGDLRHFITDDVLNEYEKIYSLGHLTLFKNNVKMNNLALLDHNFPTATYKQAYSTSYNYHFIEDAMKWIALYSGCKCYEKIEFADVSFRHFKFTLARGDNTNCPQIYRWKDGHLFRIYIKHDSIIQEEISYIHLQKRKMINQVKDASNGFIVIPNFFIDDKEILKEFILENSKDTKEWRKWYKSFWINYYINTIKQGGLSIKLDKTIRKILYFRNIPKLYRKTKK